MNFSQLNEKGNEREKKKGKKYPVHQIARKKKILDEQKSPPPPNPTSRVKWSAPKYTQTTVSVSNVWINELGYRVPDKLNKIKVSQNNCIHCIFFANKRESPAPCFTLLENLKLENIFKLKIGALVHKIQ